MKRVMHYTVLALLLATAASAEERPISRAATAAAIAGAADMLTTAHYFRVSLAQGRMGHEGNPILSPMESQPAIMLTVGAAIELGSIALVRHFLQPNHPTAYRRGLWILAGVHSAAAVNNIWRTRQHS